MPALHLNHWRLSYVSEGCMLLALLRCSLSRISHRLKSVVHIEVVVYELSGIWAIFFSKFSGLSKTESDYCQWWCVAKDMDLHAILNELSLSLSLYQRNHNRSLCSFWTKKEWSICSMSAIKATGFWQKQIRTLSKLFVRSGPESSILFNDNPLVSAAASKTTRILSGFWGW